MLTKTKLHRRLESYWRLELFNAVLLPATAIGAAVLSGHRVGPLGLACLGPMVALLVIGGLYWRGKARALVRRSEPLQRALGWADRLQRPLLVATAATSLLCLTDWVLHPLSVSRGDRVIAVGATVLAVLEYINYYHRQLQHFDHVPDFRRLMTGKGFRRSQMSADLRRWRQQRKQ